MSNPSAKSSKLKSILSMLVIPIAYIMGWTFWTFVLGNPDNFTNGDTSLNPLPASEVGALNHYMGVMYHGGFVVPFLLCTLFTAIIFSIERAITIRRSKGTGSIEEFIQKIRTLMMKGDVESARKECEKQRGSIANVVNAGLTVYSQMEQDKNLDKERKLLAIQKELEEATTLELPMLSKNLMIISTIASVATLLGLFGTVLGMIRAFSALAQAGAPDAVALSTGISEALINTALGVITSAIAIIMYNTFTSRIDNITYGIDEAGYTLVQSFNARIKHD
ncbi:MAG: MotA/TolQ/ExbB proton channel family protein [Bacteroidetes bacterium]|nr:MAG: MotA/TolQ/ExbB proton channel family protein [Bacteroidota bacterium]REK00759.1 MAG: MotA/TolQ/ExbB proton channel family protein [Bacteroidota bacterium]REK35007.1 MAG: MotA/TolQ/ExbB proton channel family protein [Bacteroidota bacterium]REK48195.1 MAG: MotA/TolQ/ExbB proton channel family protein [Bacteroidota bacterium]